MESTSSSQVWIRRGAVAAAALLVVVIAYILIKGGDNNNNGKELVGGDAAKIQGLAADEGHPVYWAGPTGAETFEWTSLPGGGSSSSCQTPAASDRCIYIRYLTGGAQVGDPGAFLSVGTYPVGSGVGATKRAARSSGSRTFNVNSGGIALNNKQASSVYLAYPGSKYQIEVYDPHPGRALRLVTSGKIQQVP
jgi:hypothetical protein